MNRCAGALRRKQAGRTAKAAGGRWSKEDKLWQFTFDKAVAPGLERRVARR